MKSVTACPYCGDIEHQVKAGMNGGHQRYKCGLCQRRYTPESPGRGYADEVRARAALLRAQGTPIRQIARQLGVNHQSVANWLGKQEAEAASTFPASPPTPMKRRPTIGDVARRAGVSTSTVSNFLNQKGRMAEETRQRVQAAMEALHFTPSALVQAIRHRRSNILGVLIFGLGSLDENTGPALTPPLLSGIHDGAAAAGNDLLLYTGWPHRARGDLGLRFLDGHIDGLLWVAPAADDPALERAVAAGLPVVALLTRHVPAGVGYVNADNIEAMRMVISHLVERGHRRIAFIGPERFSNFLDRQEGYRQALDALGLPWDPALQAAHDWKRQEPQECARVLDSWLALPSPPTAIACATDHLAARFAEAIQARGLRVPEDMALTGFDDTPSAAHVAGGLTTVRQPLRQMGRTAAESVLALVEGKPADSCRLTVATELVVRASTGSIP